MKHFMIIAIIASFFSISAFAAGEGQTDTECPMMREMNRRTNPKANLTKEAPKPKSNSSKAAGA